VARFEDRLFAELVEQHGQLLADAPARAIAPAAPRRVRRTPIAAIALAIAVALAALVIGLSRGGGGSSAYAVVTNPDGTVTVTISELIGVGPANVRLKQLGLPVAVAAVRKGCPVKPGEVHPADVPPDVSDRIAESVGGPGNPGVRVDATAIPAGDTLLLTANERRPGFIALRELVIEGAPPPCVPPGPGE
jgi:hypothetical protein